MKNYTLTINANGDENDQVLSCSIETDELPQTIAIKVLNALKPPRKRRSDAGKSKTNEP